MAQTKSRKIKVTELEGSPVSVYYNNEWEEYQVRIKNKPEASYHTPNKTDALQTAQHLRNHLAQTKE